MKKTIKLLLLIVSLVLVFSLSGKVIQANNNNATETKLEANLSELEEQPSDLQVTFNKDYLPYILAFLSAYGGSLLGLIFKLKKINQTNDTLVNSNNELNKNNKAVTEIKEMFNKEVKELFSVMYEVIDESKESKKAYETEISTLKTQVNSLLKIEEVKASNDTNLVKNGIASEIIKVIKNEK